MKDKPTVININTQQAPNWVNTVVSTLSKRVSSALFGVSKGGKRDLNDIYGYTTNLDFPQMYWMWRRGGLAFRVINSVARSCWRDKITVLNDGDERLVDELKILNKYGKLAKRLEQADILNRIGRFSVLFIGVPDGLPMKQPLGTARAARLKEVYFRAYAEDGITIHSWNQDKASFRFGLPETYQLQTENRGDKNTETISEPIIVHWTRVVHLAEGSLDSDVEGVSALEPIFNTLEDIVKTAGGSAEAYFRNARSRFSMETDPKYATSFTSSEKLQLEEEAMKFQNEWQDFIRAGGMQIKALNIPHASPMDTFMVALKIVSGSTGIPMRILTGEGGGQLAGNEDKESWNQLIQDRRDLWCNEWVERVLMVLNEAKMLELDDDDDVKWSTPDVVSAKDKSAIAAQNATALNNVATALSSPALDGVMGMEDAFSLVFAEDAMKGITFQDGGDDGLSDEELAAAELENGNENTGHEDEDDSNGDDE